MHVKSLTLAECKIALSRAAFGRLACARDNQPYVVPVYFAFEEAGIFGNRVYCFSQMGQKIEWMRSNPLVCLEIDDVRNTCDWTSVLVFGRFEELRDTKQYKSERQHAYELLSKRALWWEPGTAARYRSGERHSSEPIYFRISVDHVTGHQGFSDSKRTSDTISTRSGVSEIS